MKLRDEILREHSKAVCNRIVDWIGNDQQRFDQLFDLFLHDEYRVVQRAAWPLSNAVMKHPAFISRHFSKLLKNLQRRDIHEAVKRNTLRLLQFVAIPARFHGMVMNTCFDYIQSPAEKPAIKAFSLTVLYNLSRQYPDIKQELKTIIDTQWEHESAAFRSRAKHILKDLK